MYRKYFWALQDKDVRNLSLDIVLNDLLGGDLSLRYDLPAQSRIMSSYGFIQLTHYTVTDMPHGNSGFTKTSSNKLPEYLNDQSNSMPIYVNKTNTVISRVLGNNPAPSNWSDGFEATWFEIAGWYNPRTDETGVAVLNREYAQELLNNSRNSFQNRERL